MKEKKEIVVGIFVFAILFIFFVIHSSPIAFAKLGSAEISRGWDVVYSSDTDYFVWVEEQNKQKTQICLLSRTADKLQDNPVEKRVYTNEKNSINFRLNRQQKTAKETGFLRDFYGYCRVVNTEDYLKFGENSTILSYVNGSRISYVFEENLIDITLYKKVNGNYIIRPDTIFLENMGGEWKFGANDSENTGIEQYKYVVDTHGIENAKRQNERVYVSVEGENHIFDFEDICSYEISDCVFNDIGNGLFEVEFYSEAYIEPIIQVSNQQSFDIDLEAIDTTSFLVAVQQNNTLSVLGYYINGTKLFPDKLITSNVGTNARVDIARINSTAFVLGYLTENNGGEKHYIYLNYSGQNTTRDVWAGVVGTPNLDLEIAPFDDRMMYCHAEDSMNNAYSTIFNYSILNNGTAFVVDGGITPSLPLQNLVQCDIVNDTSYAYMLFNDAGNNIRLHVLSKNNSIILNNQLIDGTSGEQSNIALTILNGSRIYTAWVDDGTGDVLKFAGYNPNGTQFLADTSVAVVSNTDNYIGMTSLIDDGNREYIIIARHDRNSNNINSSIFYSNGTFIRSFLLATDVNSSNIVFDIKGENVPRGFGTLNDTFLVGYTNSSRLTKVVSYHINGSISSEVYFDLIAPSVLLNTPANNLITNILLRNFTANATDNFQLSSANLIVYNSTAIVKNSTISISGASANIGIEHTFLANSLYLWYYFIKDANNNLVKSEERNITIDTTAPIVTYVAPTETNGSLVFSDELDVNLSIQDLSPTNSTIYLMNKTGINFTTLDSFFSTGNTIYHKFSNLSNGEYFLNSTTCDVLSQCSNTQLIQVIIGSAENIELTASISHFPYAEPNTTINITANLIGDGFVLAYQNVSMSVRELNGSNTNFQLFYNPATTDYRNAIIFTELGNFPFTITAYYDGNVSISGTFIIKNPYYITIQGFENTLDDEYINNFAYVTAELKGNRKIDKTLEPFFAPIRASSIYGVPVWFGEYEDGEAVLKLWDEDETYLLRLIDGNIIFTSNYAVPNVTKSYGTNAYIGEYTFSGVNETIKVIFTDKDLKPYTYLYNWLLLIGLGLSVIAGVFIFFVIPDKPIIALSFTILIAGGIIVFRIFIFIWKNI